MPKTIELTVEIVVQRVSCPGVWLCQDGSVSLVVAALGTNYETCTLPPTFPLDFKDRLYFRKRFQETCALSNMCCLLKDETLYCELVQWCQNCNSGECNILAQYLGSLSDVLFPPKMCCSDGVDLLMRRSKKYPGILSPKIEIATKVRIDEVWDNNTEHLNVNLQTMKNIADCNCIPRAGPRHSRQKTVCHTPEYHRNKCHTSIPGAKCRTRSRSRSGGSGSSVSRSQDKFRCAYSDPACKRPASAQVPRRDYCVFNVNVAPDDSWNSAAGNYDADVERSKPRAANSEDKKVVLESRYVDVDERHTREYEDIQTISHTNAYDESKPCVCEICKRYHELFHADSDIHVSL
ncbi:uncharacterized protein LOC134793539 isoform X1 [Cydia splendana]|uniref:uncharacterized protein LOC134793539 isoform X1 n=1 Tax=Cydia splendana TaxID=1100963 RepID=UPI0028F4B3E4